MGWYCGAGVFGLIGCISLSLSLALPTFFNNNNNKQMLEGDIPQDRMTCLFFVKEVIRKLSDLNPVIGNNTKFILIGGTLIERTRSFEQELGPRIR